ncbi:hypothetical protein KEM48_010553 [Puccinia striiformis f. sp. tritici PST-130]|nr:hypothetical protein KEM48_010553 [Puccinia striiformis f. sp. tritici PST-130]
MEISYQTMLLKNFQLVVYRTFYFTYGPTHHFGNAQQNAAYSLIHCLSDPGLGGISGHGPILSIDDGSNFLPELLVIIWDVHRIVYDPSIDTLLRWEAGAIQDRKFPIDSGAFAFASELLGSTIKGPRYWPTHIRPNYKPDIEK